MKFMMIHQPDLQESSQKQTVFMQGLETNTKCRCVQFGCLIHQLSLFSAPCCSIIVLFESSPARSVNNGWMCLVITMVHRKSVQGIVDFFLDFYPLLNEAGSAQHIVKLWNLLTHRWQIPDLRHLPVGFEAVELSSTFMWKQSWTNKDIA